MELESISAVYCDVERVVNRAALLELFPHVINLIEWCQL